MTCCSSVVPAASASALGWPLLVAHVSWGEVRASGAQRAAGDGVGEGGRSALELLIAIVTHSDSLLGGGCHGAAGGALRTEDVAAVSTVVLREKRDTRVMIQVRWVS